MDLYVYQLEVDHVYLAQLGFPHKLVAWPLPALAGGRMIHTVLHTGESPVVSSAP
jgi:hypothetical protein